MYPIDRRKIAVHIYALLRSLRKVARLVDVSHSTVARWLKHPDKKQYKQRGSTKSSDTVVQILRASIAAHPFTALADLRQLIKDTLQLSVSKELVRTIIKKLGFSKKKAKRFGTSPDLESKTAAFIARRDALLAEGRRFYSIDETSFGRNGPATYGYALRGQPLLLRKKPEKSVRSEAARARLLRCKNDTCKQFHNRNANATRNMIRIVEAARADEARPADMARAA
jgi:transposase